MGPRSGSNEDMKNDISAIKSNLTTITESIDQIKSSLQDNKKSVTDLLSVVDDLTKKIAERDKQITFLENKINEMEQYQKKDNIIISGPDLQLHTYSHVAGSNEKDGQSAEDLTENPLSLNEENTMKTNFNTFVQKHLKISIKEEDILSIHKLRKRHDGIEPVIVKFARNSTKRAVMSMRKKLKGTKIYINDHLTRMNSIIERKAREMKKSGSLHSSWTLNGRIFVKEKEHSNRKEIKKLEDLN